MLLFATSILICKKRLLEVKKMKFIKGVMLGGIITTGLIMMYSESDKKNLMKKSKRFVKKMGMM